MNALLESLKIMPEVFSSNDFCKKAKQKGIHQSQINSGLIANFLKKKCTQISRRTWQKKHNAKNQSVDEDMDEIAAIFLLKSKGYKVMKPSTEWLEV